MMPIYALLLSFFSLAAFALDATDVQLIDQFKIVHSKVQLHSDGEWGIDPKKMDSDEYDYGLVEFKDLSDWKNIDQDKWFDLGEWEKLRDQKDNSPRWRTLVRNHRNPEIIGRVIKCIGICRYYVGLGAVKAHHQTTIREGDEFVTEKNSYAWVTLIDGTLVRISPNTSIAFMEVNLSPRKTFFLLRLNYGHFSSQVRMRGEFEVQDKSETDLGFLPLMIGKANREYYAIQEYRKFDDIDKLVYSIAQNPGHVLQFQKLNELNKQGNEIIGDRDSQFMIYTPNATLSFFNTNLHIYYTVAGETHFKINNEIENFKKSTDSRIQTANLVLRGYDKKDSEQIKFSTWYRVSSDGTQYNEDPSLGDVFYNIVEGFWSRIPTIQLARELIFQQHTAALYHKDITRKELAQNYLYYLWDDESELNNRFHFLQEYIRRVETTNLQNIGKAFKNLRAENFNKKFYAKAMQKHYYALRMLYTENKKLVRELNDNQYYLWLLRNAKE